MSIVSPFRPPIVPPLGNPLGSRLPWEISGGTPVDPALQIIGAYAGAGWATPYCFIARAPDASTAGTWVNKGTGGNATQGTGAAQPTFSLTSFNGRPGLTFDTGDLLATSSLDLSAYTAMVLHIMFLDTAAGAMIVAERSVSAAANDGACYITVNETAGTVRFLGHQSAGNTIVDSTAETMAAGHVITGTWDQALATNESEIRIDGVNATASRVTNTNTSGGMGNHALFIGARSGISSGLAGTMAALVMAVGTTAIPLTTVSAVEATLKSIGGTP